MMNTHIFAAFGSLMLASVATSASAQVYQQPPGYPAQYSSQSAPDFDAIDDDDAMSPGPNYASPQALPPPVPAPRGPVMSPNDPRYGAPAGPPPVIYSDRPQPGYAPPRDGGGLRPPEAIGVTGSVQQPAPVPQGAENRPVSLSALPPDEQPEQGPKRELPPHLRRAEVAFPTKEPAGTLVVDTPNTHLYYVLGNGRAIRYGVRVGRDGFTWNGVQKITQKKEWPDWHPPTEMIERQPYLPRFMAGGEGNPLGARAMYLGNTVYRIHGTNQPSTIGQFVSSGCIGMLNEDVSDLFERTKVGTRVVVLPGGKPAGPATASAQPLPPQGGQPLPPQALPQGNVAQNVPGAGPTILPPLPAPVTVR